MSAKRSVGLALTGPTSQVHLSVIGYQFPSETDGDLNWLMISGEVSHPRGPWSFLDPALETHEVAELCLWLERVAAAPGVPQAPVRFIEPNIRLYHRVEEAVASVIVRLSNESAPPWCESLEIRLSGVELTFPLVSSDLIASATRLRGQLAMYPAREENE